MPTHSHRSEGRTRVQVAIAKFVNARKAEKERERVEWKRAFAAIAKWEKEAEKRKSKELRQTRMKKWIPHPIYTSEVRRAMVPLSSTSMRWYDEVDGKPIHQVDDVQCPVCHKNLYWIGYAWHGWPVARLHCPDCNKDVFRR
jgi:hypothetical protein